MTYRSWCFTVNNVDPEIAPTFVGLGCARYAIWQLERAETGTLHLQGYVEFHKPHRMTAVKLWLNCDHAHLEPRRGSRDQARDYCRKADSHVLGPWELGTWSAGGQGKRTDHQHAVELLRAGGLKRCLEVLPEYVLKHPKNCKEFLAIEGSMAMGLRDVRTLWIQGPTGIGKSWHAFHLGANLGISLYPLCITGQNIWFDGYAGEDILCIDELNNNMIPESFLLRLLDKYPLQCQIKGSMAKANWIFVVITSNFAPSEMYPDVGGRLARRITWHMKAASQEELSQKMDVLLRQISAEVNAALTVSAEPVTCYEVAGNTSATSSRDPPLLHSPLANFDPENPGDEHIPDPSFAADYESMFGDLDISALPDCPFS